MKYTLYLFVLSVATLSISCSPKSEHQHEHTASTLGTNDALYEEVMKIHDEVMPKMNDIYKQKEELKKQLTGAETLSEEKRKKIETEIAALEEAGKSMMLWMREFNPPADSLGEEVVRQYLEGQLESVKKVKENILKVMATEGQ